MDRKMGKNTDFELIKVQQQYGSAPQVYRSRAWSLKGWVAFQLHFDSKQDDWLTVVSDDSVGAAEINEASGQNKTEPKPPRTCFTKHE